MSRPLRWVRDILKRNQDIPLVIAGDIFDRWNAPAELINFALKELPDRCHAIPGNHDLPQHSVGDIRKSAYWTLAQAGKIKHMEAGNSIVIAPSPAAPSGTPCVVINAAENERTAPTITQDPVMMPSKTKPLQVALFHSYVWNSSANRHPGADSYSHADTFVKKLIKGGYHAAVFGDNHHGFKERREGGLWILNCGCLIRRKLNERETTPGIHILYSNGTIGFAPLNITHDKWDDSHQMDMREDDERQEALGVIDALEGMADAAVNYRDAVERFIASGRDRLHTDTVSILREVLEEIE